MYIFQHADTKGLRPVNNRKQPDFDFSIDIDQEKLHSNLNSERRKNL